MSKNDFARMKHTFSLEQMEYIKDEIEYLVNVYNKVDL